MLFVLLVGVVAAAFARLRGGRFERLAETRLRWVPLVVAATVVQTLATVLQPPWLEGGRGLGLLVLTQAAVAVFLVVNRSLAGMLLAGAGLALNVLVIVANGAMPVWGRAANIAGGDQAQLGLKHEVLNEDTRLPVLADVIPVPGTREIISIGDVLLAGGIGRFVYGRMRRGRHAF